MRATSVAAGRIIVGPHRCGVSGSGKKLNAALTPGVLCTKPPSMPAFAEFARRNAAELRGEVVPSEPRLEVAPDRR